MLHIIRNWITSIAASTAVKLAAQVTALEDALEAEENFTNCLTQKHVRAQEKILELKTELTLTKGDLEVSRLRLNICEQDLEQSKAAYRSLLSDWSNQCDELNLVTLENQELERQLEHQSSLNQTLVNKIIELTQTNEKLRTNLSEAESRVTFYKECYRDVLTRRQ